MLRKELGAAGRGVDLESVLEKHLRRRQQLDLRARRARRYKHIVLRYGLTHRQKALQQSLVITVAYAGHLARRCHVDAQHGVGILQSRKGELRRLDTHVVYVKHRLGVRLDGAAQHHARSHRDEVELHDLRHEGEAARSAQVALDDLHVVVLGEELYVEGARDIQLAGDLLGYVADLTDRLQIEPLRGEHYRRIARMHTGKLHMLAYGRDLYHAPLSHGIHLDLLGVVDELAHHDGVVGAHLGRLSQITVQLVTLVDHMHRGAREHIRRTYQHGQPHLVHEVVDRLHGRKLTPPRLVDTQSVAHRRELTAILRTVDRLGRGAEDIHALTVQRHGQIVRYLPARRDHNAVGRLELDYIHHALECQLVEIEPVADVVIGRHGFGVVVYHHRAQAHIRKGLERIDTAPVELHAAAYAVGARTQHDDRTVVVLVDDVVLCSVVCKIEVVRLCRILSRQRIYLLDARTYARLQTAAAYVHHAVEHRQRRARHRQLGDLEIREAHPLGLVQHVRRQRLRTVTVISAQCVFILIYAV